MRRLTADDEDAVVVFFVLDCAHDTSSMSDPE